MLEGWRVAVVVPAHDEERLIGRALRGLPRFVDHVVVVDDASADDTAGAARRCGDPRVEIVRHERNLGVGAAIATGYRRAFAAGADVAAVMAGDAQMDPDDLCAVVEPIVRGAADYVKGDRLSHPSAARAMPPARWVANHALSLMTRVALGMPVRDSQCGFTAISRSAASRIELERLWPGYGYPNDLLGRVQRAGLRVREVVVRPVYADERSGIRLRHGLVVPWIIARAGVRRLAARA